MALTNSNTSQTIWTDQPKWHDFIKMIVTNFCSKTRFIRKKGRNCVLTDQETQGQSSSILMPESYAFVEHTQQSLAILITLKTSYYVSRNHDYLIQIP